MRIVPSFGFMTAFCLAHFAQVFGSDVQLACIESNFVFLLDMGLDEFDKLPEINVALAECQTLGIVANSYSRH